MGLHNFGKTCVQVSGFRDLVTSDGEVHRPCNSSYDHGVSNSNQSRGHRIKDGHPLSKHAIIEKVYTVEPLL